MKKMHETVETLRHQRNNYQKQATYLQELDEDTLEEENECDTTG